MTKNEPKNKTAESETKRMATARDRRLKEALRENLHRRKQQGRVRKAAENIDNE